MDRAAARYPWVGISMRIRPIYPVVAAAALLRLLWLGTIPAGLYTDEAMNGYNAYSLATTLRDAWGHLLPLFVRHYGVDVVEPLYVYLMAPVVRIWGLSPFTVRLEAALVGTATVWLTYLLVREIADRRTALWAAILLAVSPWHLPFSRTAFRAIWVPFVVVLALLFWYRIRRRDGYVVAFAAVVGLGLYTYTPMRAFLPAMLVVLAATSRDVARRALASRYRIVAAALLALAALPVALASLDPQLSVRTHYLLVTSRPHPLAVFLGNLASHLSPRFLLLAGDGNARHGVYGYGVLSPVTAALVVVFLVVTVWRRRGLWTMPALVLAAMATASLTIGGAHALRSLAVLPLPQVMAAFAVEDLAARGHGRAVRGGVAAAIALFAALVLGDYFRNQPLHHSGYDRAGVYHANWWVEGTGPAIRWAQAHRDRYDGVALSSSIEVAYIFPAFWVPIPPTQFQHGEDISPYHVVDWPRLDEAYRTIPRALFVVQPWELPEAPAVKVIRFADGEPALRLVESAATAR